MTAKMTYKQAVSFVMKTFNEEYAAKFSVTNSRLRIWDQMLRGFEVQHILAAAYHLVSTRPDWPPDIATMRQQCLQIQHGELHAPTGQEAWENILKKFQHEDYPLTDMEKAALAQVGTIYDLKRSQNSMVDRANFVKAFDNLVAKQQLERATLPNVRALVEYNVPLLENGEEPRPELPESTVQDEDRPPLPPRTEDGSEYPTYEEVKGYVQQLSDMFDLSERQKREEAAERAAIESEALDRR